MRLTSLYILILLNFAILQGQCTDGMCTFRVIPSESNLQDIPQKLLPGGQGILSPLALTIPLLNYQTICPDIDPNYHCCSQEQINNFPYFFEQIDITFGSGNGIGGCDFCAANLKKFWCHLNCDPNQANWVSADETLITISIDYYPYNLTALNITAYLNQSMAHDMFDSCSKTSYVRQVPVMQTQQGFMQFQAAQSVNQLSEQINFKYDSNGSFTLQNMEMNDCASKIYYNQNGNTTDKWGYPIIKNCSCNNCQSLCSPAQISTMILPNSTSSLFDKQSVLFLCLGVIGLSIIILAFLRAKDKRNQKQVKDQYVKINDSNKQQLQACQ